MGIENAGKHHTDMDLDLVFKWTQSGSTSSVYKSLSLNYNSEGNMLLDYKLK